MFAARKRVRRVYVKKALTEQACEFKATAKDLEQRNER